MYRYYIIAVLFLFTSCQEDESPLLDENILEDYITLNNGLERDFVIACAAGKVDGMHGVATEPTAIYFYPISGSTDFRYYETLDVSDSLNFDRYVKMDLPQSPLFNGYLRRWNREAFVGERMGIVTYQSAGKLHVSDPIRIKTNLYPTEVNSELLEIETQEDEVNFEWQDGIIDENVIYFQVISDDQDNLLSGTYTYEKNWTFYDTSNVVLNITSDDNPELITGKGYTFTMMAVSEDNWVNLLIQKDFVAQ